MAKESEKKSQKKSKPNFLFRWVSGLFTKTVSNYHYYQYVSVADLKANLQPGDVLLVDGKQRSSEFIQSATQSTWSHAALYVGDEPNCLIEATVDKGIIAAPLEKYQDCNTRICRPTLISPEDCKKVIAYARKQIDAGVKYDMKNAARLGLYYVKMTLFGRPRRKMANLSSNETSHAICSTLIAGAFHSVGYPILPEITRTDPQKSARDIMLIMHHSLFTPRDFDLSPYFEVVKPTIEKRPDYKKMEWKKYNDFVDGK